MATRELSLLDAELAGLEHQPATDVLSRVVARYHPRIALASSFGAEDVVLIDMLMAIDPAARVFTLDTGRLPAETYTLMDAIRERYGLRLEVYFPQAAATEALVREAGLNCFYRSIELRKRCCGVRKVEPLGRALTGLEAWITGLRREQAVTRAHVRKVELDTEHGLLKINPLADWASEQVWAYIRERGLPYNALHDRGYPSIGCAPCTRAVAPGEDPRGGRWWWEGDPAAKECGLHSPGGAS